MPPQSRHPDSDGVATSSYSYLLPPPPAAFGDGEHYVLLHVTVRMYAVPRRKPFGSHMRHDTFTMCKTRQITALIMKKKIYVSS